MINLKDKTDSYICVTFDDEHKKLIFTDMDSGISEDISLNSNVVHDHNLFSFGLIPNQSVSLDKLLVMNLSTVNYERNYFNNSVFIVNAFRKYLFDHGLMNRFDIDYLNSISFCDDDFNVQIEDLSLNARSKKLLIRSNFDYLWQLLVFPSSGLKGVYNLGNASYNDILSSIRMTGYTMSDIQKNPINGPLVDGEVVSKTSDNGISFYDSEDLVSHIHRVIDANKVYISMLDEMKTKFKESNEELYELEKKICAITDKKSK